MALKDFKEMTYLDVARALIFSMSIFLFLVGTVLAAIERVGSATAVYTAAILLLVFAFLNEFKRFKGFGVEAELLDRKIKEADFILERLRNVIVPIAEMLVMSSVRMGRWDTALTMRERYDLVSRIEAELRLCDISGDLINKIKAEYNRINIRDIKGCVDHVVVAVIDSQRADLDRQKVIINNEKNKDVQSKMKDELKARRDALDSEVKRYRESARDVNDENYSAFVRDFIRSSKIITQELSKDIETKVSEVLNAFEYYILHRDIRNVDVLCAFVDNSGNG